MTQATVRGTHTRVFDRERDRQRKRQALIKIEKKSMTDR